MFSASRQQNAFLTIAGHIILNCFLGNVCNITKTKMFWFSFTSKQSVNLYFFGDFVTKSCINTMCSLLALARENK